MERPETGAKATLSRSSRMSSTELFDAASISMTSSEVAFWIVTQASQTPHGSIVGPARSSGRPRGSWPSTSCPSRAIRRTGRRGGPCPARSRCSACGPRAPARRRPRSCGGGGGGRATGRRTRTASVRAFAARPAAPQRAPATCGRLPPRLGCRGMDEARAAARFARPAAVVAALGAGAWALAGTGLVNYDTLYSLVWGRELTQGRTPDFDQPLAPTPHPLGTLLGVLLSPLSKAADGARPRRGRAHGHARARVPRARRARLGDLRARRGLVRSLGRASSRRRSSSRAGRCSTSARAPTSTSRTSCSCSARCSSRRGAGAPARRCSCCSPSPG